MDLAKKNWYTFVVPLDQNKNTIRQLVERTFGVEVEAVKTMVVKGKTKRSPRTRRVINRPNWKKAMVRVKEGQKIELYDMGA